MILHINLFVIESLTECLNGCEMYMWLLKQNGNPCKASVLQTELLSCVYDRAVRMSMASLQTVNTRQSEGKILGNSTYVIGKQIWCLICMTGHFEHQWLYVVLQTVNMSLSC